MSATEIMLERETANDESALVVTIHVPSGRLIEKDVLLFEIENSKAVQEIWSTSAGILLHHLAVGQDVQFGVPIARILTPKEWAEEGPGIPPASTPIDIPQPKPVSLAPPPAKSAEPAPSIEAVVNVWATDHSISTAPLAARLNQPRISHPAAALIAERGLQNTTFTSDFVTTRIIHEHLGLSWPAPPAPTPAKQSPQRADNLQAPKQGREIQRRKRVEIDTLTQGAGDTMLSVLGVALGPLNIKRVQSDLFNGKLTDLVIYEASRLMKKYPNLNASYSEDRIIEHPDVHAGLAIDSGGRLVVYGIEHADRVSLHDLSDHISDAVERYMSNTLTSAEMSRATFTVTDLSADELDFVFPLLPRGQSCILGITHSSLAGYRIFAGFDHRVTEGREIAGFLGELRDRLLSFASTPGLALTEEAQCGFCGRSADEVFKKSKDLGLLKLMNRDGNEYLCCASCWNGW